jgi:S-(hydroxymethyl)glutathione dehydrogenase/alcohol dehydrogenase
MRAAVLRSLPGELEVSDIDVSSPGPNEVLIETMAAGLCHSDLSCMNGTIAIGVDLPVVLGHESAGVVEAVGKDVTSVRPGDRVMACNSVACGACKWCMVGRPNLCISRPPRAATLGPALSDRGQPVNRVVGIGGFAEKLLLPDKAVVKIGEVMPFATAALLGCAVTTGLGAALNTAKVTPGAIVAVIGCGGIGLNIVQGAIVAGARRVIAIDIGQANLDLARQFGATDLIDASKGDPVVQVRDLTGGGVQYSFEAIGNKTTMEQAFAMLEIGGVATIVGLAPLGTSIELPTTEFLRERRIQGSLLGSNRFQLDIPYYVDLYEQGRLKLDELVSKCISLDNINESYREIEAGSGGRHVVTEFARSGGA